MGKGFASLIPILTLAASAQPIEAVREESRQIMRTRLCGVCHIPPGRPQALRIFNLDQINWTAGMTERQLEQIKWRIKITEREIKEQRGDPKKHQFAKKEIEKLEALVDAEIKERNPFRALLGAKPLN
jgi:hypothetical protein